MILIALMWAHIPLGPDNFKILSKLHFHGGFDSAVNTVFSSRLFLGRDPMKVVRL